MQLSKERLEWPTAIHEAGHAVIARVLGIEVIDAVIAIAPPDGGLMRLTEYGLGGVQMRVPRKYGRVRSWHAQANVSLAGRIAQERACRGSLDPEVDADGVLDADLADVVELTRRLALLTCFFGIEPVSTENVKEFIESLVKTGAPNEEDLSAAQKREIRTLRKRLTKETSILVEEHWTAIERVAEALLSGRVVSGDEVDALIGNPCRYQPADANH